MAGGSQIIINKDGITIITPAKFEAKAGQHLFKKGSKVNFSLPEIPNVLLPYRRTCKIIVPADTSVAPLKKEAFF